MDMVFKDSYLDRSGHRDTFTHLERTRQAMLLINQIRWHLVQGYSSAITSASGVLFYHDVTPEDAIAIVAPVKRKVSSQSCESKRRRLESEQTINDLNVRVDKLKERISVLKIKDMRLSVLKKLVKVTKRLDTLLG